MLAARRYRPLIWLGLFLFAAVAPAAARRGAVRVTSFPSGAKIFVDGRDTRRHTPEVLTLEAGEHEISVRAEGWVPVTRSVNVRA